MSARFSILATVLLGCATSATRGSQSGDAKPVEAAELVTELELRGQDPVRFVIERLREVDLVLFDDGLHSAVEPFAIPMMRRTRSERISAPPPGIESSPAAISRRRVSSSESFETFATCWTSAGDSPWIQIGKLAFIQRNSSS